MTADVVSSSSRPAPRPERREELDPLLPLEHPADERREARGERVRLEDRLELRRRVAQAQRDLRGEPLRRESPRRQRRQVEGAGDLAEETGRRGDEPVAFRASPEAEPTRPPRRAPRGRDRAPPRRARGTGTAPRGGCCSGRPSSSSDSTISPAPPIAWIGGVVLVRPRRPASASPCRSSGRPRARRRPSRGSGARRCGAAAGSRAAARRPGSGKSGMRRLIASALRPSRSPAPWCARALQHVRDDLADLLVGQLALELRHRIVPLADLLLDRGGAAVGAPDAVDQVRVRKAARRDRLAVAVHVVARRALALEDAPAGGRVAVRARDLRKGRRGGRPRGRERTSAKSERAGARGAV